MFPDPIQLDLLARLRPRAAASLLSSPTEKAAFSPSPAVQQAVMGQAQAGPPPGGDPAAMGGGMPPGAGGMGGPPPGGDPMAGGGGAPPADPNVPAGPSPEIAELKQMISQLVQQQGMGPNGKPATMSAKLEPQHFQQLTHDISTMKAVMTQMADQLGLQVPASDLLNQTSPGAPSPLGQPGQPGQQPAGGSSGPAPDQGGGAGGQGGAPGQPQPMAQQLPSLPPVASKAAVAMPAARTEVDMRGLHALAAGFIVGGTDSPSAPGSQTAKLAVFARRFTVPGGR